MEIKLNYVNSDKIKQIENKIKLNSEKDVINKAMGLLSLKEIFNLEKDINDSFIMQEIDLYYFNNDSFCGFEILEKRINNQIEKIKTLYLYN